MAVRDLGRRGPSTIVLDPNIIQENPTDNTRDMDSLETLGHIQEMAEAICFSGNEAFPPITIYQDKDAVYVASGWCRRRAHVLAMEKGAPVAGILCLMAPKKKPEDLTLSILTSNDGLPLTAMEKAAAVKRLQSFLWTPTDIAKKTGWSVQHVTNLIALHDAPESITDMVKAGVVSATLATNLVKEKGADAAKEILDSAVDTAKKAGKSKATKKDLQDVKKKAVNWKKHGPNLYDLLKAITECPTTNRALLMEKISAAGELVGEIELEIGEGEF